MAWRTLEIPPPRDLSVKFTGYIAAAEKPSSPSLTGSGRRLADEFFGALGDARRLEVQFLFKLFERRRGAESVVSPMMRPDPPT